jgi:hypothetical protein
MDSPTIPVCDALPSSSATEGLDDPPEFPCEDDLKVMRALAKLNDAWDAGYVTGLHNECEYAICPDAELPFSFDQRMDLLNFANVNSEVATNNDITIPLSQYLHYLVQTLFIALLLLHFYVHTPIHP